jgi:hypothetical protein
MRDGQVFAAPHPPWRMIAFSSEVDTGSREENASKTMFLNWISRED